MAPAPTNDPRIPPLVAAAVLACALLLGGWPRPVTGEAAAASAAVAAGDAVTVGEAAGVGDAGAAASRAGDAADGRAAALVPAGWRAPLDGPVVIARPFEPPANPYGPGHRGVDLRAPAGATVHAAGDGVVTYAGVLAGRGVVTVSHGALRTTYEPVDAIVTAGERVVAGTPLGRLAAGHPGCVQGACLHWGLLRGATYLSPLALLLPDPPRLLPLTAPTARADPAPPPVRR